METAAALIRAFGAAYRPYVAARLAERGLEVGTGVVDEGEVWLRQTLESLLSRPFAEQTRSPLEVFQEALRFPTEALRAAGAPPVPRDPVATAALPGDLFDLAPASSQALGEEAWQAHIAWGAAKAADHARPAAILVGRNLIDSSKVRQAADRQGYALTVSSRLPDPAGRYAVAFVDLEHPDADDAVRTLAVTCGRVIAFGPHVDDFAMVRARSLGASEAVPRSRFFNDPGAWLPPVM